MNQNILEKLRDEYLGYSRIFTPCCDRERSEVAVSAVYESQGYARPHFMWVSSPVTALKVVSLLLMFRHLQEVIESQQGDFEHLAKTIDELIWRQWRAIYFDHKVHNFLHGEFIRAATKLTSREFHHNIDLEEIPFRNYDSLIIEVATQVLDRPKALPAASEILIDLIAHFDQDEAAKLKSCAALFSELQPAQQSHLITRAIRTIHDLGWSTVSFCRRPSGDAEELCRAALYMAVGAEVIEPETFEAMRATLDTCGWWWPTKRFCLMVDRAVEANFDENFNLHQFDGMALRYADGWGLYALRGLLVDKEIAHGEFTAEDIDSQNNVELRRVMIERYGVVNYIRDTDAEEVQRDAYGVLYRKRYEIPNVEDVDDLDEEFVRTDEDIVLVKLINSTAEPDGTYKEYFLRVPPDCQTARAAVAWSFGLEEHEYAPAKET